MDSTILHLFGVDEILERLARRRVTGCFHIFTVNESANIFFRDGLIVAAIKGQVEGGQVVKQILEWKSVHYLWQPDAVAPPSSLQPLKIVVHDFLARPDESGPLEKAPVAAESAPGGSSGASVRVIPAKGKSTGPLPVITSEQAASLTATKTFSLSPDDRAALDAALLKKYPLVLVPLETPEKRLKITRVSNLTGRNPACDLAISHPSISRQHCLLQLTERGLHVKDLDTTNGTRVNGIALKEGYISAGDKLTIGHVHFMVEKD
jgi:hypothetical protein